MYKNVRENIFLQYSLKCTTNVKEICKPLQNYFGIHGFGYLRLYNDCSYFALMNGYEDYLKKHIELVKSQDEEFQNSFRYIAYDQPNFHLWQQKYNILPLVVELRKNYNVWNALSIQFRNKDYIEDFSFWFGVDVNDRSDFFIRNLQSLLQFCKYFKIKAADLLNSFDKKNLPFYKDKFIITFSEELIETKKKFEEELNKNLFFISKNQELVTLTSREHECIFHMMQHKTAKEIGQTLNISYRTVEHYIENAKQKLGVNYKNELIEIISKNNLLNSNFSSTSKFL